MTSRARLILWTDGLAGGAVGAVMLVLRDWLVGFFGLPLSLVTTIAAANLGYATYALSLAALSTTGRTPRRMAIDVLIGANAAWSLVCLYLIVTMYDRAGVFGLAHMTLEGLVVLALARVEYRHVRPEAT